MIRAYSEMYLDRAQTALATMLDFAVNDLGLDPDAFFELFLISGIADRFGSGDPATVAGRSGTEIALDVLTRCGFPEVTTEPQIRFDRTEEYWTGWALAYYQWDCARSFRSIIRCVPVSRIRSLYHPYHEMDLRQFADQMNRLCRQAEPDPALKRLRLGAALSQRRLSEISGVHLRTIQQYEQGQKNIRHARAECLLMLASALCCSVEDLV